MVLKECKECKILLSLTSFSIQRRNKDGLKKVCKTCSYKLDKIRSLQLPIEEQLLRREKKRMSQSLRYSADPNKIIGQIREYQKTNKGLIVAKRTAANRKNNWDHYKEYHRIYCNDRYKNDTNYRLALNLRSRLYAAIKNNQKTGSAVRDLGCSIEELKIHLESKFVEGMSWANHTTNGWHIDHIRPLIFFNLSNREELLKACHYSNLQPLWASDNVKKGGQCGS